jgi:outer membrane protein
VTTKALPLCALALAAAALAQAQSPAPTTKVGVIHIQNAIIGTKDGQKAAAELQTKFDPKRKELEKKQADIAALQDQLNKGRNTMSVEAREKLIRDIDQQTKSLNRNTEDAQMEMDQEQNRVLQELGQKMMAVIDKYARDNNYTLILDVSSPQTPVLYISSGIDITQDIVKMYDANSGAAAAPAAAPPAPKPAAKKK